MGAQSHRIGTLHLALTAPDRGAADLWVQRMRAGAERVLLPAIGAALDAAVPPDRLVLLDRLELDLGDLDDPGDDPALFQQAVTRALVRAVEAALRRASGSAAGRGKAPSPADLAAVLGAWLVTGGLPWPDPSQALQDLWSAAARLGGGDLARLLTLLAPSCSGAAAARRLLTTTPPAVLQAMVLARAGLALPGDAGHRAARVPSAGSAGRGAEAQQIAALQALAAAPQDDAAATRLAQALVPGAVPVPGAAGGGEPGLATPARGVARDGTAASEDRATAHPPLPTAPLPTPAHTAPPKPAEAPLMAVPAAGLVLLHPYLAPFLDRLGLLAGPGRFADRAAQGAAVRAVLRLATGAPDAPEADCALAKILCGLAPADALPPVADPDPRLPPVRLETEADALLRAVIAHWTGLGTTSPEGLRDGFLRRPGALDLSGPAPRLLVEGRGLDVLLDRLPWTIGMVRTPFMAALLRVEWGG